MDPVHIFSPFWYMSMYTHINSAHRIYGHRICICLCTHLVHTNMCICAYIYYTHPIIYTHTCSEITLDRFYSPIENFY